jgi:hypothetical protein
MSSKTTIETAQTAVLEVKPTGKSGRDAAATRMYEALMYIMLHPTECSATIYELARDALETAGLDYQKEVAAVRAARIGDSAEMIAAANDPYQHLRQLKRISPTEPEPESTP